jgi:prepilin-type N-terminal cleavage/methylation domain-containing protein
MFCHMKKSTLKLVDRHHSSAGFTLVELLVAISIMGLVASFISYAVSSMINSNQSLAKEQNRRVEATRALDLIGNDIQISQMVPATLPTGATSGTVAILSMDIVVNDCPAPDTAKNRITYLIKPVAASSTTEIGPNVIYRHGLIPRADGTIDCTQSLPTGDGDAIADAIDIGTITLPTCTSPTGLIGSNGFYSCGVNISVDAANKPTEPAIPQQVSIALFSKLSNTKTAGINRTVASGYIPDTGTPPTDCSVPDLTSTSKTPTAANTLIIAAGTTLLYNGINIESGGTRVLTQNPLPGAKLPCNKGLVTYTY